MQGFPWYPLEIINHDTLLNSLTGIARFCRAVEIIGERLEIQPDFPSFTASSEALNPLKGGI